VLRPRILSWRTSPWHLDDCWLYHGLSAPSPSTPPPLHPTPAPLHPNLPQPAPAVDQVGNQLQLSWLPSDDGGCATLYNVEGFDPSGKRVLSSAVTTPNATAAGLLGLTKVRACTRLRLGQLACSLF
jgi:hypothetical protein